MYKQLVDDTRVVTQSEMTRFGLYWEEDVSVISRDTLLTIVSFMCFFVFGCCHTLDVYCRVSLLYRTSQRAPALIVVDCVSMAHVRWNLRGKVSTPFTRAPWTSLVGLRWEIVSSPPS